MLKCALLISHFIQEHHHKLICLLISALSEHSPLDTASSSGIPVIPVKSASNLVARDPGKYWLWKSDSGVGLCIAVEIEKITNSKPEVNWCSLHQAVSAWTQVYKTLAATMRENSEKKHGVSRMQNQAERLLHTPWQWGQSVTIRQCQLSTETAPGFICSRSRKYTLFYLFYTVATNRMNSSLSTVL